MRRIMVTAQIVLAIDAAILSTLVLTGAVQLWMVFVISAMDGVAGASTARPPRPSSPSSCR
ncbi:membrane protein [Cutibacterium acnes JCM 18918]|nr:membrane protein [Cutibacterium acnes JCM 18918]